MRNKMRYTARFDHTNPNWSNNPEYNTIFLRTQENYFTALLQNRGFLVLNDVLLGLGLRPTRDGMVIGWRAGATVDFGLNPNDLRHEDILLTFNVDGNIYEEQNNG